MSDDEENEYGYIIFTMYADERFPPKQEVVEVREDGSILDGWVLGPGDADPLTAVYGPYATYAEAQEQVDLFLLQSAAVELEDDEEMDEEEQDLPPMAQPVAYILPIFAPKVGG